jgi:hypothetical protein
MDLTWSPREQEFRSEARTWLAANVLTGARITTTLLHALQAKDKQVGLETMCAAGGQGMAMVIERLSL